LLSYPGEHHRTVGNSQKFLDDPGTVTLKVAMPVKDYQIFFIISCKRIIASPDRIIFELLEKLRLCASA